MAVIEKEYIGLEELKDYLRTINPEMAKTIEKVEDKLKEVQTFLTDRLTEGIAQILKELLHGIIYVAATATEVFGYISAWIEIHKRLGLYKAFQEYPIELLDNDTLFINYFRGNISIDQVAEELSKKGFNSERIRLMLYASYQWLNLEDIRRAYLLQIINRDEAVKRLEGLGYTDDDANLILNSTKSLLSSSEYIAAWLRGMIDDQMLDYFLSQQGLQFEEREILKFLAYYIPPVQDIIRMAVREVFTPDLRKKYGLDEEFPTEFAYWAQKQGVSEEWAKNYWAAHWELPSITDGMTMLQRLHPDIINWKAQGLRSLGIDPESVKTDIDTLRELIKMHDITPYWRDRLIALSYNPVTRVDIRRLFDFAIFSYDDVVNAYRDLGYDPQTAKWLADFTVYETIEEERNKVRNDLLELYERQVISENELREALKDLKFNDLAIDVIVTHAKYQREKMVMDTKIKIIERRFKNKIYDENKARIELAVLALPAYEIDNYIEKWRAEMQVKVSTLTSTEIQKALKAGLLTKEKALDKLLAKGYSKEDAEIIIAMGLKGT
jgi:SOS response regulatory protein OraA/RecX